MAFGPVRTHPYLSITSDNYEMQHWLIVLWQQPTIKLYLLILFCDLKVGHLVGIYFDAFENILQRFYKCQVIYSLNVIAKIGISSNPSLFK